MSGYCLTFVRDIAVADAVVRLGGVDTGEIRDLEGLVDHAFDTQSSSDFRSTTAGLSEVDGWALIFESNGFLGVTPTVAERLAGDSLLVSHLRNVNAHGRFSWWDGGKPQLGFEPLRPSQRDGPRAEDAAPIPLAAGFEVEDRAGRPLDGTLAATFALAERLTGVVVTADLLTTTRYTVVQAPMPRWSAARAPKPRDRGRNTAPGTRPTWARR